MPTLKTRIQHTHDTEAKWNAKPNFVPKAGEVIVYDPDSANKNVRFKIGDGTTKISKLAFFAGGGSNPSKSMLDKMSPDLLNVQYSTQCNGWRVHATQLNGGSGTIYVNDYECNTTKEYSKVVELDPSKTTELNIQRINQSYLPGDYSFANVKLKPILNVNHNFKNGTTDGWTLGSNSSIDTISIDGKQAYAVKTATTAYNTAMLGVANTANWEPNTTYELSFKVINYSQQSNSAALRVRLAYYNTVSQTASSDVATTSFDTTSSSHYTAVYLATRDMNTVKIRFTTKSTLDTGKDYSKSPITFYNYDSSNGSYLYITDITIKKDINLLPASLSSWNRETWYYPISKMSPLTSDTAALTVDNHKNLNAQSLAKYTLAMSGNSTLYELSTTATRLTKSYQWQDYITLTDADKYALINNDVDNIIAGTNGYELPKMGGPWASVIEPEYNVKAVIDCSNIKASCALIGAKLPNAKKARISLNTVFNTADGDLITSTVFKTVDVNNNYCYAMLPVPEEVDYYKLELIVDFETLNSTATNLGDNCLELVQVYGAPTGYVEPNTNFTHDYHGNIKCLSVHATSYVGTIDDGRLLKLGV